MSKLEKISDPKEERLRLQNLKLKLEIWKIMKVEGFTLSEAHEAFQGRETGKLETPALEQKFETAKPEKNEWSHFCKSAGRTIIFPKTMQSCSICGTRQRVSK